MISFEIFLAGLLAVSTSTSLVTEAVKKMLTACNINYNSNILAGIVAAILGVSLGVAYVAIAGIGFTALSIVCIIGLAIGGWMCAMVGYDKVVQLIGNLKTMKKG